MVWNLHPGLDGISYLETQPLKCTKTYFFVYSFILSWLDGNDSSSSENGG